MGRYATPLRYPGGKQKIAPFIEELLISNDLIGGHYAEVYAGGAGIAIDLLVNGRVSHAHINDSCKAVYAFWQSIVSSPEEFCRRISRAILNVDEWRKQRAVLCNPEDHDQLNLGFSAFYLNRCNRSGILSGGLIGGLRQDGNWTMDARFPRNELISRIEAIASKKKFLKITNLDAEKFIETKIPKLPPNSLVYFDPPYFHKAERLYLNHYLPGDHARIAKKIQNQVKRPWLVSYDNTPEILTCYRSRRSFSYDLQYNAGKVYLGSEVLFFSDKIKIPKSSAVVGINQSLVRKKNN